MPNSSLTFEGPDGDRWVWQPLPAPGWPAFGTFVHADPDEVLARDLVADPSTQTAPYFASLWPAGAALGHEILLGADLAGLRVLDLGCGCGVVGLAAGLRGAEVVFQDAEARTFAGVRAAAARLGLGGATCLVADWGAPPPAPAAFDRVLAADVLYEAAYVVPVARHAAAALRPGGALWLADPGRATAAGFDAAAAAEGLPFEGREVLRSAPARGTVTCARYRRRS